MTTKVPKPMSAAELARCSDTAPAGADTNDGITISRAIYDAAASIREGLDNLADAVREQTKNQERNALNIGSVLQEVGK